MRLLAVAVGEVRCDPQAVKAAQAEVKSSWDVCFVQWQRARVIIHQYPTQTADGEAIDKEAFPPTPSRKADDDQNPHNHPSLPPIDRSLKIGVNDLGNHSLFLTCFDLLSSSLATATLPAPPAPFLLVPVLRRYLAVLFLLPYTWHINIPEMKVALKVATILLIVSLPWLIEESVIHFDNGYWIPIAVAFSYANEYGQAVYTCMLRILGTMLGACFGALAVNAVIQQDTTELSVLDESTNGALLALLFVWMMVCAPFRLHPKWSYGGTVAIFTAPIVIFGWNGYRSNYLAPSDLALARISENAIGLLVYLIIDYVVWPVTATGKLIALLRGSLVSMEKTAADALDMYSRLYIAEAADNPSEQKQQSSSPGTTAQPTIAGLLGRVEATKQSVAQQEALLPLCLWEPPVSHPYCHDLSLYQPEVLGYHQQLFTLQGQINHLTFLLLRCVERATSKRAADDLRVLQAQCPAVISDRLVGHVTQIRTLLTTLYEGPKERTGQLLLPPEPVKGAEDDAGSRGVP